MLTGMSDASPFLRAIWDTPHDDGPRLVYADWLDERGDVRGEFIRTQCELARASPGDPRLPELRRRQGQLQRKHGAAWRKELPTTVRRGDFERGFLAPVKAMAASTFLGLDDSFFRPAPLWRVRLTWASRELIPMLAESPHLPRLTALSLAGNFLIDDDLVPLLESWGLENLTELDLSNNGLGPDTFHYLADAPALGRLERLWLSGNGGFRYRQASEQELAAEVLADSGCLIRLGRIYLSGVVLCERARVVLAEQFDLIGQPLPGGRTVR
jgi:uncharacterized protein (TIGR02996 family)